MLRTPHKPPTPAGTVPHIFPAAAARLLTLGLALLGPGISAQNNHAQNNPPSRSAALAVYNGEPILEEQLPPELVSQLRRMEQQVYLVRLRGLHEVIDRQLIATEAARQKVTPNQLIGSQIARVPDPTQEQMKAYYDEHKSAINQPFDEAREGVRSTLKNISIQSAGRSYTQTLFQDAMNTGQLTLLLRPPQVDVSADPKRLRGDAGAPVTIVEFSDFSCSYCRKAEGALNDLLARHPGQVRLSYRDFPLPTLHPNAILAAEASRCAADQDQYWPYHDVLFARIDSQNHDDLIGYARDLKLDVPAFTQCLNSGQFRKGVEQDRDLGIRAGIVATPAFFVNGYFFEGAQAVADFEGIVQRTVAAQAQNSKGSSPQTKSSQ